MDTNTLFSAAIAAANRLYGQRPKSITIQTHSGCRMVIDIPTDWEPQEVALPVLRSSADCFTEVLQTILEANHRLTRAALLSEMEAHGRRRAESTVCLALEDLMRLGVIDNRSDVTPRGYGLPGWTA